LSKRVVKSFIILAQLVKYLQVKVRNLTSSSAPLGYSPALLANIKLGRKGLPRINAVAARVYLIRELSVTEENTVL